MAQDMPDTTPVVNYTENWLQPDTTGTITDMSFRAKLTRLLNAHSAEGESDTPDFILVDYLMDCLTAFNKAVNERSEYYQHKPWNRDESS